MTPANLLNKIRTPFKLGRHVLTASYKQGTFDSHAVDCPFVFFHNDRYYMTYVGFDTIGYRTGLGRIVRSDHLEEARHDSRSREIRLIYCI
jgi:hypothetical protein